MYRKTIAFAALALLSAVPAQAADVDSRLELLTRQVLELQDQVTQMRAMLKQDSAGNAAISVTGSRQDVVGGSATSTVGVNASAAVGGNMGLTVGHALTFEAGDQVTLKAGLASVVLRKSGEIQITGATIRISGSADVVIKGAKVQTN